MSTHEGPSPSAAVRAVPYDAGTPIRGEREYKTRRFASPLHEFMDTSLEAQNGNEPDAVVPDTPPESRPASVHDIALLLQPMQATMNSLELQMVELKLSVDKRLKAVESRLDLNEVRVDKLENMIQRMQSASSPIDPTMQKRLESLEAASADNACRQMPPAGELNSYECTAVLGGLVSLAGMDEAETWLTDKLWSLYGPRPVETYCKGDFKGILFAKFSSKGDRDTAVAMLRRANRQHGDNTVWAKPDAPLEERTLRSFMFAAKHVMNDWGWELSDLWVEPEAGVLKLARETIITAVVKDGSLCIEYGKDWEPYFNTAEHPDMMKLVADSNSKLSKGSGKGGHKGKKGKKDPMSVQDPWAGKAGKAGAGTR